MGKGIAILGIWLAVSAISFFAPSAVEGIMVGAIVSTLIVALAHFN